MWDCIYETSLIGSFCYQQNAYFCFGLGHCECNVECYKPRLSFSTCWTTTLFSRWWKVWRIFLGRSFLLILEWGQKPFETLSHIRHSTHIRISSKNRVVHDLIATKANKAIIPWAIRNIRSIFTRIASPASPCFMRFWVLCTFKSENFEHKNISK